MGLVGAEAAKRGWRNDCNAVVDSISQSGFRFVPRDVGEERGGVTGALLEILRGGGRISCRGKGECRMNGEVVVGFHGEMGLGMMMMWG